MNANIKADFRTILKGIRAVPSANWAWYKRVAFSLSTVSLYIVANWLARVILAFTGESNGRNET